MADLLPTASVFLEENSEILEQHDTCSLPSHLWQLWCRSLEPGKTLLVRFQSPYDDTGEDQVISATQFHTTETERIYLPARFSVITDSTTQIHVEPVDKEPPVATKIVLKPLDNSIFHGNIEESVAEFLSNWHVLRKGQTIAVPLKELGGYLVEMFVEDLEPASLVLLRGEVPLELAEPLETVQEWTKPTVRPPTPIPDEATMFPVLSAEDFAEMTHVTQNPLVQRPTAPTRFPVLSKNGFIPFTGQGHTLGGSK